MGIYTVFQKMVFCILEQVQAIHIVLSADRRYSHLLPTWQDTEVLEAINTVLSSLDDLTDFFSGEHYVSISSIKSVFMKKLRLRKMMTFH